ncbi:hypothetical protein EV363DRAFT_642341 [Boletus edulis]|nr:hypothetical protein EV363DRAFT_642341 [Boletus edulis]
MPVCPLCPGRFFQDDNAIRMHQQSKHRYSCGGCDRVLNCQQALDQHIRDKHTFECRYCDRKFNSEVSREQHEDAEHSTIECRYCDREFNSEGARQQHENAKHAFECHHCDRHFNSEEARQQHENAEHVFECRHCDRTFLSENAREQHEDTNHSAIECRYCDREFSSEDAREQHEAAKHHFKCKLCGKIFVQLAALQQHNQTVPHFECNYCATGLFTLALKKSHEVSCGSNPGNYRPKFALSDQCDGESASSSSPSCSSQDEGETIHSDANGEGACTGDRSIEPCICSVCRRTSSSDADKPVPDDAESVDSSDESHQDGSEDHRDVSSFQCTPCLKVFETEEAFRQHVCAFRTIVLRPHCPVCYNQFDDGLLLQKHMEGLESFSCQICLTRCCSDEMLQDHLLSHPTCGRCGKSFADHLAFCAHVESDHPVVVCWDCDGIVVETHSLELHYAESSAHPTCAYCGVGKRNTADMNEHFRRVHPSTAEKERPPGGNVTASADREDTMRQQLEALLPSDAEIGGPLGGPGGEPQSTPLQTESSLSLFPLPHIDDEAGKPTIVNGEDAFPSPTPSEHGSDTSRIEIPASKVTITATNNDTRPLSPASSDSTRSFSDLSTRNSPSSLSSNSVVFVSVDGIPEYIRDNRAILVATSAGSPLRVSSSSLVVSLDTSGSTGARETRVSTPPKTGTGTYRLHCRICLVDPCEDMTATICGHLFCKRCITQAVVGKSECPVCGSATLLYCLFKLDLSV